LQLTELCLLVEQLGLAIKSALVQALGEEKAVSVVGLSDSGDASFDVDVVAERVVFDWLRRSSLPLAVYTEESGFLSEHKNPGYVLVIDPLDGSRAFKAGLESACVSIALARFRGEEETHFSDVLVGCLLEVLGDRVFLARRGEGVSVKGGGRRTERAVGTAADLGQMAWAFEVCGRPARELFCVIGELINRSAVKGGCFLFNSTTFAISRIVLGWLDAFIDVGARIVEQVPGSVQGLADAGQKQVLGLFPYDLAAAYLIAQEAGVVITDAYARPLDERRLLGSGPSTRLSCIAARDRSLHRKIMDYVESRFEQLVSAASDSSSRQPAFFD